MDLKSNLSPKLLSWISGVLMTECHSDYECAGQSLSLLRLALRVHQSFVIHIVKL